MARKRLSDDTMRTVIVQSRRRCCMCYGLSRDASLKQGQIAHLDRNPSNDSTDNLTFLCLDHHDQYDSRTSQSKGFLASEVKEYRNELYAHVNSTFVSSDELRKQVEIEGHYIRESTNESAEIKVWRVNNSTYHVEIFALWGLERDSGPHTGDLEFDAELRASKLTFSTHDQDETYDIEIFFKSGELIITEDGFNPFAGMNVAFSGKYAQAA